ncbi:indolepyruvate oxidoreductase subunit beta [Desulfuribacillus stibiiarsenatis]|uniref:Indolepyruvate oxidoreductase subunit beta n=1 Tax=Desulfuribacillus stibiiarsenatis TaxID=1390249 RepID=A0A1E5LA46_9FIRM|nr:indolepyruvate oxidoreductase subunit beta [Desulfuribacillus stibiiarsenatis]OEH86948.1 indolepyruvate oxidoreductase subunit beta [Desulfuribacillus stibiiarsenatis]
MDTLNILLVGVGGQGTILASKLMSQVAIDADYDVKMSEIKGMSQRGGSVVTQVRIGDSISSPTIDKGEADFIAAFELLEGYRWAEYLKPNGKIFISNQVIEPMPVIMGIAQYPNEVIQTLDNLGVAVKSINALEMAMECGTPKAANVVLMGYLAKQLPIEKSIWEKALEKIIPSRFLELNKLAFEKGYQC